MTVKNLIESGRFHMCHVAVEDRCINKILCSDIHSHALDKLNNNDLWITVSSHINTLAVAKRRNISCLVITGGIKPDADFYSIAMEHGVSVLLSDEPTYETALIINDININLSTI